MIKFKALFTALVISLLLFSFPTKAQNVIKEESPNLWPNPFIVDLTISGVETSCGYVGIYLYRNVYGSWQPVGVTDFYVNGLGTFEIILYNTIGHTGEIKYVAIYYSEEGGYSCLPLIGYSSDVVTLPYPDTHIPISMALSKDSGVE